MEKIDGSKPEKRYKSVQRIGEGATGNVYKGVDILENNKLIAIKKIKLEFFPSYGGIPFEALREISILKELSHPNIVVLLDVLYDASKPKLRLIFDYFECDLHQFMENTKLFGNPISNQTIKMFSRQLLSGISYLHKHRIIHRDLKPKNILINPKDMILKIADFGMARTLNTLPITKQFTPLVATFNYRAPEIFAERGDRKSQYGPSVDIWGMGCIFFQLYENETLFDGYCEFELLREMLCFFKPDKETRRRFFDVGIGCYSNLSFNRKKWAMTKMKTHENALELFSQLIELDPSKRISAIKALENVYFSCDE